MKKTGFAIAVLLIVLSVGYVAYDRLGGNNPVEIELIEAKLPTLSGKTFKGQPQNPELGKTFQSIEILSSLNPGKKIHTVYFKEPGGKLDTMEVFVGLDLPFASADLEILEFAESRHLRATIKRNKWVMPSPEQVKKEIEASAKSRNLVLSGVFIDRIISESEVQVIAPIR